MSLNKEEIIKSKSYKVTRAALDWYKGNPDADVIDGFEAGWDASKEVVIGKACEWLEKNADAYIGVEGYAMLQDKFFEDFCKAMGD